MSLPHPARWLFFLGSAAVILAVFCGAASGNASRQPVVLVLVLVEELTWGEVREATPLTEDFDGTAVANLSTFQGAAPADPRMGYVLLGAGARVDSSLLPENLPEDPTELSAAFRGPAAAVRPGTFGEALDEAGVKTVAIGEKALLVTMDKEGRVPITYDAPAPSDSLEEALARDADFVAVQAGSIRQAGRLANVAGERGAEVAVASPGAPVGSATGSTNLAPFVLWGSGEGLLYSPTTRTEALVAGIDVAPTLLARLGVEPPREMQGRPATVVPGGPAAAERLAERLGERLSFVAEKRSVVWISIAAVMVLCMLLATLWRGKTGASFVLLALAALPMGALVPGALPPTNVPAVIFSILASGGLLAAVARRFSGTVPGEISLVYLTVAAVILADTAFGGPLMKLSTLGYNPAYGTRFYGIGNEYSAFLAGGLTVGVGALVHRRRLFLVPVLAAGLSAVLILGLPAMGADVGGSLALGLGFGATVGLLRKSRLPGLVFWTGTGLAPAAGLFLTSGLLFPGVSHGSQAAGGETGLAEILVRKLLLSLDLLLNPVFLMIFAVGSAVVLLAWRQSQDTAFGAGLLGAAITALASGALNDSGILAAIFVLAYPAVAGGVFLVSEKGRENNKNNRVR